jgi:hypothetical protein
MGGTIIAGSILAILISFRPNKFIPIAMIKIPPTEEISLMTIVVNIELTELANSVIMP